jgi:hypothetical protein
MNSSGAWIPISLVKAIGEWFQLGCGSTIRASRSRSLRARAQ